MADRTRIDFAGINFSAYVRTRNEDGSIHSVTVPRPAFKKILRSGNVRCDRTRKLTDDYHYDAQNKGGKCDDMDPEEVIETHLGTKPWLLIYKPENPDVIRFCPYQACSFNVIDLNN